MLVLTGFHIPVFISTYSAIDAHPALKAASPQACIGDFFFDDFHHNGAYLLSYFRATSVFGTPKDKPVDTAWYKTPDLKTQDQYQFFLDAGPLSNLNKYFQYESIENTSLRKEDLVDDFFWQELIDHPNYDSVWQKKRNYSAFKKHQSRRGHNGCRWMVRCRRSVWPFGNL